MSLFNAEQSRRIAHQNAFHGANPKICTAVRATHEEANAFIKREPKAAAEIYFKADQ